MSRQEFRNLLAYVSMQWQCDDLERLPRTDHKTLQHYSTQRAEICTVERYRKLSTKPPKRGSLIYPPSVNLETHSRLIVQVLVSGAHSALGFAIGVLDQPKHGLGHFRSSVRLGIDPPLGDPKLLTKAKASRSYKLKTKVI